jgi:hypothetical protein
MSQDERVANRRRSDGDGRDAERAEYRAIAEEAYRLFVEDGRDRSRLLDYWQLATTRTLERRRPRAS